MPARAAFRGSRAKFMEDVKEEYAKAVQGGYAKDSVAIIQQRYLNRYPIDLPHEEEPSAEHLEAVDDDAPEIELKAPDPEIINDDDEYEKQAAAFEERRRLIIFRKAQIQRRLAYQYGLDHDMDPNDSGAQTAHRVLLHKLTGEGMQKPRLKTASNIWRRSHRNEIEAEAKKRAGKLTGKELHKKLAALREKVAKDFYARLSEHEKESWKRIAKEEHDERLLAFEETVNGPPSESPDDRQRVIQSLACFVQPILDLICEATGWKATLIAGGPEPADEGRLNIVSVHSGTTRGDIKMNFGRSEQVGYQKYLTPIYHNFLRKCYSVEECRARTLPQTDAYEGLQAVLEDNEHDASMYRGGYPTSTKSPTPPSPGSLDKAISASRHGSHSPPPAQSPPHQAARTPSPQPSPARTPSPSFSTSPRPSPSHSPAHDISSQRQVAHIPPLGPFAGSTRPASVTGEPGPRIAPPLDSIAPPLPGMTPVPTTSRSSAITGAGSATDAHPVANAGLQPGTSAISRTGGSKRPRDDTDQGNGAPNESSAVRKKTKMNDGTLETVAPPQPKKKPGRPALIKDTSTSHTKPLTTYPVSVTPPPKWFRQCHTWFSKGSPTSNSTTSTALGPEWNTLLVLWEQFESRMAYADIGRLPAKRRPDVVSEWIKNARSDKWQPKSFNLKLFRENFASWWLSLQPEWRVSEGRVVEGLVEGDWGVLKMSGVNGLLSVVAALFFWGIKVQSDDNDLVAWKSAVKSFEIVLRHL